MHAASGPPRSWGGFHIHWLATVHFYRQFTSRLRRLADDMFHVPHAHAMTAEELAPVLGRSTKEVLHRLEDFEYRKKLRFKPHPRS